MAPGQALGVPCDFDSNIHEVTANRAALKGSFPAKGSPCRIFPKSLIKATTNHSPRPPKRCCSFRSPCALRPWCAHGEDWARWSSGQDPEQRRTASGWRCPDSLGLRQTSWRTLTLDRKMSLWGETPPSDRELRPPLDESAGWRLTPNPRFVNVLPRRRQPRASNSKQASRRDESNFLS